MAKTRALSTRPVIVVAGGGSRPRRVARRAGRAVARGARRAGRAARRAAPLTGLLLGAGAVGYANARGLLSMLPTIGGSRMLTLGAAGYAATKLSRNSAVRTAGLAAMVAAAFDFGAKQGGGASGWDIDGGDGGEGY